MKSNQILFLAVIAALGIGAAVLWSNKAPAPVKSEAEKAPVVAKHDDAPVAPPAPATDTLARPAEQRELANNPTQTGEMPPMQVPRLFYGIVDSIPTLEKLLDLVVQAYGGVVLQKPLLAAKWHLLVSYPNRTLFLELETDAAGSLRAKDEQTGTEWTLVRNECRMRQGRNVQPCLREPQLELMQALRAAELMAVPLRFRGLKFSMKNVQDRPDQVLVNVPDQPEDLEIELRINRDDASIAAAVTRYIEVTNTRLRVDSDWKTPVNWMLVGRDPPEGKGPDRMDKVGKIRWQAAIRVQSVEPSKSKGPITLPDTTGQEPLSIVSRPALIGVLGPEGGHPSAEKGRTFCIGTLGVEGMLDFQLWEDLGPAATGGQPHAGSRLWTAVPQTLAPVLAQKSPVKDVPAVAKMARKVIRAMWNDIPDQMNLFVGEVNAAGHKPSAGTTSVHYISMDDQENVVAELMVPVE